MSTSTFYIYIYIWNHYVIHIRLSSHIGPIHIFDPPTWTSALESFVGAWPIFKNVWKKWAKSTHPSLNLPRPGGKDFCDTSVTNTQTHILLKKGFVATASTWALLPLHPIGKKADRLRDLKFERISDLFSATTWAKAKVHHPETPGVETRNPGSHPVRYATAGSPFLEHIFNALCADFADSGVAEYAFYCSQTHK